MGEMDSENTDLYNAILAWEDTEKSNSEEPLMEDGETFKEIQEMIQNGAKLTADEQKTLQKKVYEWDEKTIEANANGDQGVAAVNQRVTSNLEFALKYYEQQNQ